MPVNLKGLTDNARKTSIAELNARLADAVALSAAVKQAHWNVKGRNFIAVHELFDGVFANLQQHVDAMAERVQQLDGVAVGTVEKVAKASSLKEYPTDLTKAAVGGSSPLARGTDRHGYRGLHLDRFIPAGAGNSPAGSAGQAIKPVHPRWRGEQ